MARLRGVHPAGNLKGTALRERSFILSLPLRRRDLDLIAVFFIVAALLLSSVDKSPVMFDGYQNLTAALNLIRHGVFSKDPGPEPRPDCYREPLFPALMAAVTMLWGKAAAPVQVLAADWATAYKILNIVLLSLTVCLAVRIGRELTGKDLSPSIIITVFACALYLGVPRIVNRLNNEGLATLFVLVTSYYYYRTLNSPQRWTAMHLGLSYGLLVLTKAQFFYLSPVIFGLAAVRSPRRIAVALIVFVATVCPWIIRNYYHFGNIQVSGRGPHVLVTKYTMISESTDKELKCLPYAFTPPKLREYVEGLFGITHGDFQTDGPCSRFNRETCFDTGRDVNKAQCEPFPQDIKAMASRSPDTAIQFFFKAMIIGNMIEAKKLTLSDAIHLDSRIVWRFLKTLPVFFYRGLWFTDSVAVCLILFGSMIAVAFGPFRSFVVIALTSHLFHVLASHNIPRFHLIEAGVGLICLAVVGNGLTEITRTTCAKEFGMR